MIEKPLRALARTQEKYPLLVILAVLTVTLFLGYYAVRLETDSSFDVLFSDDSDNLKNRELMSSIFGSTDTLFVLVQVDEGLDDREKLQDIRHPDVIRAMMSLKRSLEAETAVESAISLGDVLLMVYGRLPQTLDESKLLIANLPEEVKSNYLGSFLSEDYRSQNMLISVNIARKPGSLQKVEDNVREKVDQAPMPIGVQATLTGLPILMNRIMGFLINDNIRTVGLAIIGVFLILWFYFRSYKIAFFSVIPILVTLTWLAGTMHLMDIRITVMIASIGAMMVGMSVDYAIHLTHGFHEKVQEGDPEVTEKTVAGIGGALFASVMTTIAGFIALLLGVTPNSQTQGAVLAIGISYAFIVTMVLLPPLMILQRRFVYSKLDEVVFRIRGKKKESGRKSPIDRFLAAVAGLQVRRPGLVLIGVLIITILIIPGFGLVFLDIDDENWLPEQDDVVDSLNEVGTNFGGTDSMNLIFVIDRSQEGDIDQRSIRDLRDPRILKPMATLDSVLEELEWVDVVESPTNDIKAINQNRIPHDFEQVKALIEDNPEIKSKFSEDFGISRMAIRFDEMGREEFFEVMREMESIQFPREVTVIPQGGVPEDIELEQSLSGDTTRTTMFGFLFVIGTASLLYMSFIAGLLAFIPIIVAIIWTIGTMGYITLPFTVLTTGMLAILMGMGIDFSIHIIHSVRAKMEEYGDIAQALPEALMSTGQALSITTITTVAGFLVLSLATLMNTKRLGWTLALGILATFFSCILIVPAVLALQYKLKARRTRGG